MNPNHLKNTSAKKKILRSCAIGMSSATLLIAGTLLVAGIRSQASPASTATERGIPAVDPTERSAALAAY